ncbi:MAG: hypothetical protein NVSMB44_26810 [Ktedonobacteraceae bacterium]
MRSPSGNRFLPLPIPCSHFRRFLQKAAQSMPLPLVLLTFPRYAVYGSNELHMIEVSEDT